MPPRDARPGAERETAPQLWPPPPPTSRRAYWGAATPSRRAPRVSKPHHHTGKDAASTAAALAKAFGSSDADGCWLLSLVASDATAPWAMTYYGKVLDGLGSKKGPIKAAAKAAWAKVVPTLQPEAAPLEMKALYGASRRPNLLKIDTETTHVILRWRRVASMA